MPRKLRHVIVVNADGVELRRLNGNEFINGYSSLIAMLTHSNHDLRFVFGPEADYCVKYSAKSTGTREQRRPREMPTSSGHTQLRKAPAS